MKSKACVILVLLSVWTAVADTPRDVEWTFVLSHDGGVTGLFAPANRIWRFFESV